VAHTAALIRPEPEQADLFDFESSPNGIGRGGGVILITVLAAAINSTVVAGENPTVGSTVWLPAESVAPGR
jgi:hypothetical protein